MKRRVTLTYGAETLELEVGESFLNGDVVKPRPSARLSREQLAEKLNEALLNPIGRPRLKDIVPGKRVSVLLSDEFRAGLHEQIIESLCRELALGGPASVTFICATGSHQPAVYAKNVGQWVERSASEAGLPFVFHGHDCLESPLVELGRSPLGSEVRLNRHFLASDVRVYGHESKHHYMNGYSVLDKQVLPGVSWRRTIENNHQRSLHDDSGPGRSPWHAEPGRRSNPMAEDCRDVRHMAERALIDREGVLHLDAPVDTFALDMISDKDSLFWVGAGDPDEIVRLAVEKADEQAQFLVEPSRYVLVSPGGPPASQAMYGVQNCFDMALLGAIQDDGEALIVAPCEGRPDLPEHVRGLATSEGSLNLFWGNVVKLADAPLEECFEFINDNFELYMWKAYRVLRLFKKNRVKLYLYSSMPAAKLEGSGFSAVSDPQAWIDERQSRADGSLTIIDGGNKLLTMSKPS